MDTKYAIIQWNMEEGSFSEIAAIGFFFIDWRFFFPLKKPKFKLFLTQKDAFLNVFGQKNNQY